VKQEEFCQKLASVTPEMPESFSQRLESGMMNQMQDKPSLAPRRMLAAALAALMLLGTAAVAAGHWGIFDHLGFMLGGQPLHDDAAMQKIVHQETINGVEITIREAAYDGRTLFIQYSHRMLDEEKAFGTLNEEGKLMDGIPMEARQKLQSHNVGWWIDHFWINGECVDMAANSGAAESGTSVPGEILTTEYWRLDNLGMELSGNIEISLPIGERQPLEEYSLFKHPEKYDGQQLMKPEKGLVTFAFDAGDVLSRVVTLHPEAETVTDEVTACVREASFTPLMTYITLDLEVNSEAMAAFIAENGEGYFYEGKLLFPYGGADVFGEYIRSLHLVDSAGAQLFPGHTGYNSMGDTTAEFLYPALEPLPDALWLAPVEEGTADMARAIRVK